MAYTLLFFAAFLSATLIPMGSEGILLCQLQAGYTIELLFLAAATGNTLGSLVNWWLGKQGSEWLLEKRWLSAAKLQKAEASFDRWGPVALLLSWVPVIGDPLTFVAGVLHYDKWRFLLWVALAKGGRYLVLIGGYLYASSPST